MRRRLVPLVCLVLLAAAGCGSATTGNSAAGSSGVGSSGVGSSGVGSSGAGSGDVAAGQPVPGCPFTADQVSGLVGQAMKDEGNCSFGDGNGVASLTITMASITAGDTTFNYDHQQAEQTYDRVVDVSKGDKAYLAVKDIQAEATVVSKSGAYTLIMSDFERFESDPAGYEQALRKLLDAIPNL